MTTRSYKVPVEVRFRRHKSMNNISKNSEGGDMVVSFMLIETLLQACRYASMDGDFLFALHTYIFLTDYGVYDLKIHIFP